MKRSLEPLLATLALLVLAFTLDNEKNVSSAVREDSFRPLSESKMFPNAVVVGPVHTTTIATTVLPKVQVPVEEHEEGTMTGKEKKIEEKENSEEEEEEDGEENGEEKEKGEEEEHGKGEPEGEGEGQDGEEGEGEGEGEEEEEEFTGVDINTACMLIGGVSFVMVLFTVVNYEDDDIRRYAWALISTVTSIFVSVMIFSSVNSWVVHDTESLSAEALCAVQYAHMLVWVCCLQLTLAIASGSIGEGTGHSLDMEQWVIADAMRADYGKPVCNHLGEYDESLVRNIKVKKSVMDLNGLEVPVEKKKSNLEQRQRRMKCWGTLLAHMSAFAAINAGSTMQHLAIFSASPIRSLMPLLLNQLFTNVLFSIFKFFREILKRQAKDAGQQGVRATMFDEEVTDSENDITCLAGSFLLVQSLRYFQVGQLPTMVGELHETPWACVYQLYASGGVLVVLSILFIVIKTVGAFEEDSCAYRILTILAGMCGMGFSWCCLFGSRTVFLKIPELDEYGIGMATLSGRVLLALILSLIATALIFCFDMINDAAKAGAPPGKNPGGEIVFGLVFAMSILVGFSWENCFDGGAEAIAAMTSCPLVTQSALSAFIFFAVVPAWRKHILRKNLLLQAYYVVQLEADIARANLYRQIPFEQEDPEMCQPTTVFSPESNAPPLSARALKRQTPVLRDKPPAILEPGSFFNCSTGPCR